MRSTRRLLVSRCGPFAAMPNPQVIRSAFGYAALVSLIVLMWPIAWIHYQTLLILTFAVLLSWLLRSDMSAWPAGRTWLACLASRQLPAGRLRQRIFCPGALAPTGTRAPAAIVQALWRGDPVGSAVAWAVANFGQAAGRRYDHRHKYPAHPRQERAGTTSRPGPGLQRSRAEPPVVLHRQRRE